MAISFVGVNYAKSTTDTDGNLTINIPSYNVGDLVISIAGRDGSFPEQLIPSGFTQLNNFPGKDWAAATNGESSQDFWYSITAYKFMTDTSQTQVSWTSGYSSTKEPTFSFCAVYRGVGSIGNWDARSTNASASSTPSIQGMSVTDNRSWGGLFVLMRSNLTVSTPPSQEFTTQRYAANESTAIPPGGFSAFHYDTNGGVNGITADTLTMSGSSGWYTIQWEMIAKAATKGRAIFI